MNEILKKRAKFWLLTGGQEKENGSSRKENVASASHLLHHSIKMAQEMMIDHVMCMMGLISDFSFRMKNITIIINKFI